MNVHGAGGGKPKIHQVKQQHPVQPPAAHPPIKAPAKPANDKTKTGKTQTANTQTAGTPKLAPPGKASASAGAGPPPAAGGQSAGAPKLAPPGKASAPGGARGAQPASLAGASLAAEAGEKKFLQTHSIAPSVASAKDKLIAKLGPEFKRRVLEAAQAVGLDPGLLAASAVAEPGRGTAADVRKAFLGSHATRVETHIIGLDDIGEQLNAIRHHVPAFGGIALRGTGTYFQPESGPTTGKPVFTVAGDQALLAFASYLKEAEISVRRRLEARGIDFDALPVEQRFFLTRLRMNPGHNDRSLPPERRGINPSVNKLERGGNLFISGLRSPERRPNQPERGATIITAESLHLSRVLFGLNPFVRP